MHSHAALIVCNYRLPDQSILCSFTAGLWHFSAPPLAICQFSKSVFVYSAALRSVHLVRCVSICPRVVHPFHSLSAPFHFFTDTRGEQLLKYVLIRVSFLSLSLSLCFIYFPLSLFPSSKAKQQGAALPAVRNGGTQYLDRIPLACSTLWFHGRGPKSDGDATVRESLTAARGWRVLRCQTITFWTLLLYKYQNTLKTRSFTVQHIKIRFQRICIFSCMLKTRGEESNGVRKIYLIHEILYLNKTALAFDREKSLGMRYVWTMSVIWWC